LQRKDQGKDVVAVHCRAALINILLRRFIEPPPCLVL
jgi:hypothetical protein